jgi:hypothetical protein
MSKTFKIVDGDISDGYHTFAELYNHRVLLYIALIKMTQFPCYYKPDHYPGWDAVYLELPTGQISYHIPFQYRDALIGRAKEVGEEYEWDGHDSDVVRSRLNLL